MEVIMKREVNKKRNRLRKPLIDIHQAYHKMWFDKVRKSVEGLTYISFLERPEKKDDDKYCLKIILHNNSGGKDEVILSLGKHYNELTDSDFLTLISNLQFKRY